MTQSDKSNKKKIIIACAAAAVVVIAAVCIIFARSGYLATTMRLLKVEGTVSIEDSKGGSKPVINNLRFQSGDALNTGSDGLASVGLDDTKIVTLNNDSRAEFKKKRKQLELKLTKGSVFFNVTEKLKSDEKFEIKTSTMTAGIRGTSGIVYYDSNDNNRETIAVTDGVVEISATNPETGETKTARIEGGQKIKVYLYNRAKDSVEFEIKEITEEDLSEFTLKNIANDDDLLNRVCNFTGWDPDKLKNLLLNLDKKGVGPGSPSPTPTSTPTPVPPPPTNTPTPTPPPTSTPTSKPKPKKKKATNTPTPTPKPKKKKKKPTSYPAVPKSVPSGYEKWLWDTESKKFIVVRETSDDNQYYKGYVKGKWVTLTVKEYQHDNGLQIAWTYTSGGKTVIYYDEWLR